MMEVNDEHPLKHLLPITVIEFGKLILDKERYSRKNLSGMSVTESGMKI
jgi:hypothetical protein